MNIQTINLLVAFVATVILGIIVVPRLKKLKVGQVVRDDGPEAHLKKSGTPTMGGVIILIVLTTILIFNALHNQILWLAVLLTVGFGIIGFIDDYKKLSNQNSEGISAKAKIFGLALITAIFLILYTKVFNLGTDIIVPFVNQPIILSTVMFVIFTSFILIGTSNAVNLTDGLDGLASGVVAIIMTFFTVMAIKTGDTEMIILGSSTVGTCLGFLIFNFNPAKVFMGDTGSLALGGAVAAIAILLKMPLFLALVAIVCIINTLSVVIQVTYFKLTKGKRFFKMAPFHHHLELKGMAERKVVYLFWAITTVFCVIAYII